MGYLNVSKGLEAAIKLEWWACRRICELGNQLRPTRVAKLIACWRKPDRAKSIRAARLRGHMANMG